VLDPEGAALRLQTATEEASRLVVQLTELYTWSDPWQEAKAFFTNDEAASLAVEMKTQETRANIIATGKEKGLDLSWDAENGKWIAKMPSGDIVDATPDFMQYLSRDAGAIGFSFVGGAAGVKLVSPYTAVLYKAPGFPTSAGALALQIASATFFGFGGSVIGEEVDYAIAAIQADEALTWDMAFKKTGGAAQEEGIGLLIYAVLSTGGKALKGLVTLGKMINDGNLKGAYNMLKVTTGLNDKQIREYIKDWETLNKMDAPYRSFRKGKREMESAIALVPGGKAGGQNIIAAVAERDPTASGQIANEVAARAEALTEALALPTTNKEFATRLANEYHDYLLSAKKHYQVIRDSGADHIDEGYEFNYDKLIGRTLNRDLVTRVERDSAVSSLRDEMSSLSEINRNRSFDSLLEFRKVIEDLKLQSTSGDTEVFDTILGKIDTEIEQTVLGSSKEGNLQWFADWTQAKNTRTDMLTVQQRSLAIMLDTAAKEVRKGGEIDYDMISGAILDSGAAVKGILPRLLAQMPIDTQMAIERDMIRTVVDAWTVGNRGEFQAMQFPEIASMLREYDFQFPESRAMVRLINDFAKVYQNDVGMAIASGKIHSVQFQSYLTTNPYVRAKFEIASEVFNRVQELRGGALGDSAALIRHTAKLLENPLNPKNVSEALEAAKGDVMLERAINEASKAAAQAKHTGNLQTLKYVTFRDSKGKFFTKSGKGRTEVGVVSAHRLTKEEDVLEFYKVDSLEDLSIFNRAELIEKGFVGVGRADGSLFELADDLL